MRRGGGRSKKRKGQKPRIRIPGKPPPKSAESRILSAVSSTSTTLSRYNDTENEDDNNSKTKVKDKNKTDTGKGSKTNVRLQYNIWAVSLIGALNLFPLTIDLSTGEMKMRDLSKYKIRRFFFWCWTVFATLRISIIAVMITFVIWQIQNQETSLNDEYKNKVNETDVENQNDIATTQPANSSNIYELFFMSLVCAIFIIVWYLYYIIAVCDNLKVVFLAYNSILDVGAAHSSSEEGEEGNEDIQVDMKAFKKYILVFLPFIVYAAMLIVPGFIIIMPNSAILTTGMVTTLGFDFHLQWSFHSLTTTWPSLVIFLAFVFVDWMVSFFIMSVIYLGVFIMMLYIEMMIEHTLKLVEYIRWGVDPDTQLAVGIGIAERLMTTVKKLHCAKLQVICFNLGMSQVIFFSKIIALMTGVVGGFGAIKLYAEHPIFAAIFLLIFVEGNVLFLIIFDSAYQVGENLEALKMEVLAIAGANFTLEDERRRAVEKSVRSMQEVGIKSGGFNNMERESSLIFSDFIIGQIVDLLIAF